MKPNIGLSDQECESLVQILNTLLADEMVLYIKTRNFHWNVFGPQFNDLHKFFESQYGELNERIDQVAERARSLGGRAIGTMGEFLKKTRLKEQPGQYPEAGEMISRLLADHENIVRSLRSDLTLSTEKYHDAGTGDFLTGLMEQHEKTAWMLRAFLENR